MGIELRLPNIKGTDKEQLAQIRSYLYQLTEQLQWALNNVSTPTSTHYIVQQIPSSSGGSSGTNLAGVDLDSVGVNGVRMYTKAVSGTADLNIKTKYADFTGTGNERQTFFVFGEANGTMVYGVARASNNGTTLWSGTTGVTLSTKSGGILTVTLPRVAYDMFTIISSADFSV